MRETTWTDETGRTWLVQLPDGVPDSEAADGIPVGPPDVSRLLGLPEPVAARLHNELARRKLWTLRDVQRRPGDVQAAIAAALRLDVAALVNAYAGVENPQEG